MGTTLTRLLHAARARLTRVQAMVGVTTIVVLAGCSGGAEGGSGGGGTGGTPPAPLDHATVRFDDPGTLALSPSEAVSLAVTGDPAAAYHVRFTLLGEPLDAWIDHPTVTADAGGHAAVGLHAPAMATTFHVHASLVDELGAPGPSADRAVAVSTQGFASVQATPLYDGHRTVTEWTVGVAAHASCASVLAALPADPPGALFATAAPGEQAVVENAPVGATLAVLVRAGHFAWGCTEAEATAAGAVLPVSVTVLDRAVNLPGAKLDTTLGWATSLGDLAPLYAHATLLLGEAFIPTGGKDGSVVLNAMAALVPASNAMAFATQRVDKGWDALASSHFAALSPSLKQQLTLWTASGLALEAPSLEATLTGDASGKQAAVTLLRFGSVAPADAGVQPGAVFSWNAEPGDALIIAGSLGWEPSRYAGAAALQVAQADVPGAASVPEALAAVGDCQGLGAVLGGFGSCDATCMAQLCAQAIAARFTAALGASAKAGQLGKISFKATGDADVGDQAEPVGFWGHWIGDISDTLLDVPVQVGDINAKAP